MVPIVWCNLYATKCMVPYIWCDPCGTPICCTICYAICGGYGGKKGNIWGIFSPVTGLNIPGPPQVFVYTLYIHCIYSSYTLYVQR